MTSENSSKSSGAPGDIFATTHWSVVIAAGRRAGPEAQAALEALCRTYWFPLYAYARRRGFSKADAEDLTQEFFRRMLAGDDLAALHRKHGRFRAFLLASLKHFLANEWDRARTQKRGGQVAVLSLDWQAGETQFQVAAMHELGPDQAFDREWAVALLGAVIERLGRECSREGKAKQFEQLKPFLTAGKGEASYAEAANNLLMEETAVRVAVHRLRKRYRQLLRAEIASTLVDPRQAEEELRALFGAFSA